MTDIVYSADIALSDSVLSYLDGTAMFCIATPYFTVPGVNKPDQKKYLEFKTQNQYGSMLESPTLWVKPSSSRPFTDKFMIAWARGRSTKKAYYIHKLYEPELLLNKFKHQLLVAPDGDAGDEDNNLLKLDNQLCMVMDVLLIAKLFRIDLSTYSDLKDNTKFYVKFCTDIMNTINSHVDADSKITKDDFKISKDYINMFMDLPVYLNRDRKVLPLKELGKPKSLIPTLWSKIYDICTSLDLGNKFGQWSAVIKANAGAVPLIKHIDRLNKATNTHDKLFSAKIEFYHVLKETDKGFNPRVKPGFCTQRMIAPGKFEPIKPAQLCDLWGSTVDNPKATNGSTNSGCIFLKPQIDFKFYGQGNPAVNWKAEQIVLKRSLSGGSTTENADAAAFFEAEEAADEGDVQQFNDGDNIPC